MLMSGWAAGTAVTLVATREAATLLFRLKPWDPWDPLTLAGAAALLAVVTVAASLVPALRAANVNPFDSLRAE